MSLPTSISKRDLRRDTLAAVLIRPDGSLAAESIKGVHRLPELESWSQSQRWIAVLDLAKTGAIRLEPMVSPSDMAIRPAAPAQCSLFGGPA